MENIYDALNVFIVVHLSLSIIAVGVVLYLTRKQ